jgi:hypothetical protein
VTPGTHRAFFAIVLQNTSPNSTEGINRTRGWVLEWAQLVPLATACGLFAARVRPHGPPKSYITKWARRTPRVGNNFPRWRATSMPGDPRTGVT